jgi:hypothetical protein
LIILRLQGSFSEPSHLSCSDRTWRAVTMTSSDCLFELYQQLDQALQRLRLNANKQLTLEGVCLTIKDQLYGQGNWDSFSRGWQDLSF